MEIENGTPDESRQELGVIIVFSEIEEGVSLTILEQEKSTPLDGVLPTRAEATRLRGWLRHSPDVPLYLKDDLFLSWFAQEWIDVSVNGQRCILSEDEVPSLIQHTRLSFGVL